MTMQLNGSTLRIRLAAVTACVVAVAVAQPSVQAQARGQGAPTTRSCNLPEPFPCPVARIAELTVEPATINPGEAARITWAAENPSNMTLTPGIGRVFARGTVRVMPSATTTYTLRTEGGPDRQVVTRSVMVVVRGTQPVKVEENTNQPLPTPRLPDGKPDLQGVWFGGDFVGGFTAGFFGGRTAIAVLPAPDGSPNRPTPKPGLDNLRRQETRDGLGAGCFVESVPVYFGPGYHFQIVQNPQTVVMLVERMHLHRIIQIGAEHSADVLNGERLSYLGYSVAHWEGDTLVVDTRGFNDKVYVGTDIGSFTGGFKHSPKLHMVERFTRINYATLEVDVMLEDPDLFVSPWRSVSRHALRPEFSRIEEYICDQSPDAYKPLLEGITLQPAGQPSAPPPTPAQPERR
jgi:hypothetical protein